MKVVLFVLLYLLIRNHRRVFVDYLRLKNKQKKGEKKNTRIADR